MNPFEQVAKMKREREMKERMKEPAFYAPFLGDGRQKVAPMLFIPRTAPIAVMRASARRAIKAFVESGTSTHSLGGSTLWVLLVWCQTQRVPYELHAEPGVGYHFKLLREYWV